MIERDIVDQVWAGHPVRFNAISDGKRIYLGYYNAKRELTVASRMLTGGKWVNRTFPSRIGWDSHKYITMALDRQGRVHIAANMHVSRLNYFMMSVPGSIDSIQRIDFLVDEELESAITYPEFLYFPDGKLIFNFRDGTCGDGSTVYYAFDEDNGGWIKLTNSALLDGSRKRNAYPVGPVLNNQGWFHLAWVWRETINAESNHSLCHAKSRDLVNWHDARGKALKLPITLETSPVVDPIPVSGGVINNNTVVGFDRYGRPLISYHKFDEDGNTQIYLARFQKSGWKIVKASRWDAYRWDFSGPGTLEFEINLPAPYQDGSQIVVPVNRLGKKSSIRLSSGSMSFIEEKYNASTDDLSCGELSKVDGMITNAMRLCAGGRVFDFIWQTLPSNRDMPRPAHPNPSDLLMFEQKDNHS